MEPQKEQVPETVFLRDDGMAVVIIDQTLLPEKTELAELTTVQEVYDAICRLAVRGAPAIGVAAAYGVYVGARGIAADDSASFLKQLERIGTYLAGARPTAVNLAWAVKRMLKAAKNAPGGSVADMLMALRREADAIHDEDIDVCRRIGEHGLSLLTPDTGILTHCNAGRLAAVRYGTATAPVYVGLERGIRFRVFSDETRPLLQGIRLTAYELAAAGVDVTVICDNMAPTVMRKGWVKAVLVGCDRVAANGDTANKIGTSGVALAARYYGIPFYVCAPTSTIDLECQDGADIPIEERAWEEVTEMWYRKRMAPADVKVFNPAFDVTDAANITAIITENGIARPPYTESLRAVCGASSR